MKSKNKDKLIQMYYTEMKTLQEIGNKYGVTRERVRQWMEEYGLPRRSHWISPHHRKYGRPRKFVTLQEYFNFVRDGGKESKDALFYFISPLKTTCQECNGRKNLHIHHLKYPATCLEDIQILCCSCHFAKHRKGNGHFRQLQICSEYLLGLNGKQLAQKYNVTPGLIYHILKKWNIKTRGRGSIK